MEIEDKISKIYSSDKGVLQHFTLRPFTIKSKDFLFVQLRENSEGADIDKVVITLDKLFREIEFNGIFNLIFSFKGITFIDVSISVIFSHAQRIEMNGGELIFINVHPKIVDMWHRLELDNFVKIYLSESEIEKI